MAQESANEYRNVQLEYCSGYAVITLDREPGNVLHTDTVKDIRAAFARLQADDSIRCIVITGAGEKFFTGGADVAVIQESLDDPFVEGGLLSEGLAMVDEIEASPKPVLAAINGIAVGGGCELALACHYRIAADTAQFGQPEIRLGIMPGWGGCHRLPRLIGESRALEWLTTGRMISAQEALAAGLVCKVTTFGGLLNAAQEFATQLAGLPQVAMRAILRTVHESARYPDRGKTLEAEGFAEAAASPDAAEGVSAFLNKRAPRFKPE